MAAILDLDDVWDWVSHRDAAAADRLVDRVFSAVERLAEFPEIGVGRPELADGVQCLVVSPYVVYDRVDPASLVVLRVLHGRRDRELAFSEPEKAG